MNKNKESTTETVAKGRAEEASMSFCDAADSVLRQEGKALTYKQLAQKAIAEKLVQTESETPEISMHVSSRSEMKRRDTRGEETGSRKRGLTLTSEQSFGLATHVVIYGADVDSILSDFNSAIQVDFAPGYRISFPAVKLTNSL